MNPSCVWDGCQRDADATGRPFADYIDLCHLHHSKAMEKASSEVSYQRDLAYQRERWASYVYFVWTRDRSAVKIGYSSQPHQRLLSLSRAHPDLDTGAAIVTRGSRRVEGEIHRVFAPFALGGEFFTDETPINCLALTLKAAAGEVTTLEAVLDRIDDWAPV